MSKFNKLLQDKNMSQRQLSKILDVTVQLVNYWCTGRSIPRLPEVVRMSEILKVSIEEVVLCFVESR